MIIDALDEGVGLEAAGDRTDPGSIEIRANWMVGSSLTNRTNRKQSAWKNAEHIILTDSIEEGFIDNVWKLVVAKDKAKPCIQKVYVNNGDPSEYTMYDAMGRVDSGPLSMLLVQGLTGKKVKVATFARVGFDLISEKGLWTLDDPNYLIQKQSGTDFKTCAIPVLKEKQGMPDETKVNGHVRYYSDVVYSIFGVDYYLTKEWFESAYDVLAEFFIAHELTIKEIGKRIVQQEGGAMYTGKLGQIQKIIYGAPGTGKSFGTDDELVDANGNEKALSFRTTFHPDSDYSTFVGAYKPTMKKVPRIVQVGMDLKNPNYAADVDAALKVEEKISYEFRPQAFMNAYVAAWKEMTKGAAGKPVVLVIEEINRGNCAQIFGDLFQLLDRGDDGYSTYPIDADTDLAKWLKSDEKDENNQLLRFGSAGLGLTKPTDQTFKMKQSDWDAVMIGKKLALPPNLYIWATMNTSDQSLFPIDSAFKRRWDWKYVPIREGKYKDGPKKGQKLGWKIKFTVPAHQEGSQQIPAKDYSYDWWEFLKNINAKIFKTTESEDKKLGYFFVKPDGEDATTNDGTISADRFVSKVIFYLWNDVFKDYGIETIFKVDDAKKSEDEAKGVEFQAFFNEEDDKADVNTLLRFFKHIELKSDEEIAAAQAAQQQPTASAANQQGQNTNP